MFEGKETLYSAQKLQNGEDGIIMEVDPNSQE